jgi:hypothetical protein
MNEKTDIQGNSQVPRELPNSAAQQPRQTQQKDIWSTCKVGQKLAMSLLLFTCSPFGVTIPATVPQGSDIPEGLMNYPL